MLESAVPLTGQQIQYGFTIIGVGDSYVVGAAVINLPEKCCVTKSDIQESKIEGSV